MSLLWLGILACGIGLMLTPISIILTRKCGILNEPRNDRWHTVPTPPFGGVGVWITIMFLEIFNLGRADWPLVGLTVVFFCGFVDDISPLSPLKKIVIVSVAIFIPLLLHPAYSNNIDIAIILAVFLSTIFLVNSINLIDNMNGLASGSVIIACSALILSNTLPIASSIPSFTILGGALLGFLPFNFPTAKIFLGDSGSMTIGYWVGMHTTTLILGAESLGLETAISISIFLCVPIADTLFVVITRIMRGQKIYIGGKDHLSHRLAVLLENDTMAVLTIWTVQILTSVACMIILMISPQYIVIFAFIILLALCGMITTLFNKTKFAAANY